MEDVIDVYHLPYDPDYPLVCMDETCKQLIGEVHDPMLAPQEDRHELTMNTFEMELPRSFLKSNR